MKRPFYINSDFEIKKQGQTFLNAKRVNLLQSIKRTGSTRGAAAELKMSYQQAWHFIKEMNELSPLPLVINKRGGSNGGGTELTPHGEKAIIEFNKLQQQLNAIHRSFSEELWIYHFLNFS